MVILDVATLRTGFGAKAGEVQVRIVIECAGSRISREFISHVRSGARVNYRDKDAAGRVKSAHTTFRASSIAV